MRGNVVMPASFSLLFTCDPAAVAVLLPLSCSMNGTFVRDVLVGKANKRALPNGAEITLSKVPGKGMHSSERRARRTASHVWLPPCRG